MDRKTFIRSTGTVVAATSILGPSILYSTNANGQLEVLGEILADLVKIIVVDVFKGPIEDLIRDVFGLPNQAEEASKKNQQYRNQQYQIADDGYRLNDQLAFYAVKNPYARSDDNLAYQVPFYSAENNWKELATLHHHEIRSVHCAAKHMVRKNIIGPEIGPNIILPCYDVRQNEDQGQLAFINSEGGQIEIKRIPNLPRYAQVKIQSPSYSPDRMRTINCYV